MSNRLHSKPKEFAQRLIAYEAASRSAHDAKVSPNFRVCEKMREPLGKFMGVGGFRSLLSRALALSGAEVPWLRTLIIKPDGSLEGWNELKLDSSAIADGEAVLLAQLLGLLITFIGPALTLGILREIWPKMDDLNF